MNVYAVFSVQLLFFVPCVALEFCFVSSSLLVDLNVVTFAFFSSSSIVFVSFLDYHVPVQLPARLCPSERWKRVNEVGLML